LVGSGWRIETFIRAIALVKVFLCLRLKAGLKGGVMNSTIQESSKQFAAITALSILVLTLTSCGMISETRQEIPVKPAQAVLVNPCAVETIEEMGFSPRITPGLSPTAIRISASLHPAVITSTPAVVIDVAADGGAKPVQVTIKGIGGPIPVSASMLDERTEEFVSHFYACVNRTGLKP
jgi:hypothetical protein